MIGTRPLHRLPPWTHRPKDETHRAYKRARDLLCLLPGWPVQRVLELAPVNWASTVQRPEVRADLDANVFRQAALGILKPLATK